MMMMMMKKRKVGMVVQQLLVLLLLVLCSTQLSDASDDNKQQKRRGFFTPPVPEATPMVINRVGSSVVFPIYGNVYPNGYYYVPMYIGQPPRPYFLDPDTGSDLTWLQCDAPCVRCTQAPHRPYRPSNNLVVCNDPMCASLHSPGEHKCENPEQCDYEVEYADGGSSLGVLVKDIFPLNLTNGVHLSPHLSLGCGYDQIPGTSYHPLDGVLGLGKGKSSILSQLHNQGMVRNVVGHCLSGRGGGFLFFGDDLYDASRVVWTPMSSDYTKHYSPGFGELTYGDKTTGFKNLLVVFDSGSTFTYLTSLAYQAVLSSVKKELTGKPLKDAVDDQTLPFCWKGKKPFKSIREIRKYFKPMALNFANGWKAKTQYNFPPESYLIISSKGNVCLGILNGTEVGLENIIGDVSMQDRMVIYDNEKQVIGWVPANCDRLPKSRAVVM